VILIRLARISAKTPAEIGRHGEVAVLVEVREIESRPFAKEPVIRAAVWLEAICIRFF